MNFSGKRILVTGAAGFIGSNLTDKLLELGAEVRGIDNLSSGKLENLETAFLDKNFKFFKGDVRDSDFLLEVCKDVEILYHEAAFISAPKSIKLPELCNDVNVNGMLNILNTARKLDIEKIIFASSAAVYGDTSELPIMEDLPRVPLSPYAASKIACEAYIQAFNNVYGISSVSLRYFNVFGPRQGDSPYSGVIAIWFQRIIHNEDLIIFGDGENTRDFIYISDVVDANLKTAEHNVGGEFLNIASGTPINLTNLAKLMLNLTGKRNLKIIYKDPRLGDIIHSYADVSKAKRLINFETKSSHEEGFQDYFSWYNKKYGKV
ncbi:MAG: NAD-dependent epimerase/dehydratase family protein [Promethearchaeota archaeon]|jgi:nucleoside-diphosphate-sugar epimerase